MLGKNLIEAAAGNAGGEVLGVEDVFSTWLYTGNGSTQTITNGIDLAGEGGLVWIKRRNSSEYHYLFDTNRGALNAVITNDTLGAFNQTGSLTSFSSNGFALGSDGGVNTSPNTYASWTFRKAAKFFDVVTYTGTGSARTIAHNLGSVPGCIIVKRTDATAAWFVYHTSTGPFNALQLNTTDAAFGNNNYWNNTAPTSSVFSVGIDARCNASGGTYVAYLFAHDAGGFGEDGNQNVISCGSVTTDGSGQIPTVNLGWEPQWLLIKRSSEVSDWDIQDTQRGWVDAASNQFVRLSANTSGAETIPANTPAVLTSTGLKPNTSVNYGAGVTFIYIAIRRGPMKTPTDATKVFATSLGAATTPAYTSNFPVDLALTSYRSGGGGNNYVVDRVRGQRSLETPSTAAEGSVISLWKLDQQTGFAQSSGGWGSTHVCSMFRRAPGFFDVVAYTGNGSTTHDVSHNLGVPPEIIITKRRDAASTVGWFTSSKYYYTLSLWDTNGRLNDGTIGLSGGGVYGSNTYITATQFRIRTNFADINASGGTYIAYLFATCPGVSKCGGYTGTGTTLSIDCGFTNGARFVLIKRADAAGDWYVWDTARGIVSGNDPSLLLNSTAAEVTSTDYIDPYSAGFEISSSAPAAINASGGSYIYLAIA